MYIYLYAYTIISAQFRARADEVRGESLQFKRGELIKFRKRGGQKLLSKHVQRVKKNFSGSRKFFCSHQSEKNRKLRVHSDPVKKKLLEPEKFLFIVISVSALWWHARLFQDFRICSTVKPLFKNPLH